MKATLYGWEGSPDDGHKEPVGEVRIDANSPRAVWDPSLDSYFDPMPNDPRTDPRHILDLSLGLDFIHAMPFVFRSAPYLWAEVSEVSSKELRSIIAAAKTKIDAQAAMYLADVWLEEHPDDSSLAEELDSLARILSAPDPAPG